MIKENNERKKGLETIPIVDPLLSKFEEWFDKHFTKVEGCALNAIIFALVSLSMWVDPKPDWFYMKVFSFTIFFGFSLLWIYLSIRSGLK